MSFELCSSFPPAGDQPQAINSLVRGLQADRSRQILWGITGSGKTFTMANVIQETQRPTLVLTHNKVLAKQLYSEFQEFFPENAVCFFVSKFTNFVPESYHVETARHVDKFTTTDDELTQKRVETLQHLLNRRDVLVVASVSCLFNLGSQATFQRTLISLQVGQPLDQAQLVARLENVQYRAAARKLRAGTFQFSEDTVTILPSYGSTCWRVVIGAGKVTALETFDTKTGVAAPCAQTIIPPAYEVVTPRDELQAGIERIKHEGKNRIAQLHRQGRPEEAQRLAARVRVDIQRLQQDGYCNNSGILRARSSGTSTKTLISHLPDDALVFIDESHQTVPQMEAMHACGMKRKQTLVDHGFLLPSALQQCPMKLCEFEAKVRHLIYVSATPGDYELAQSGGAVVQQHVRPTGLLDPEVEIEPSEGAAEHLVAEIRQRAARGEATLAMTTTKAAAENLADQLKGRGIRCEWLHCDLTTNQRNELLTRLRVGEIDVIVGCNLLREGIDLPKVSLVAILEANREGFLRDETSLIQMIGRAARNRNGKAIFYANTVTGAMARAIRVTRQRRRRQEEYNRSREESQQGCEKGIAPCVA